MRRGPVTTVLLTALAVVPAACTASQENAAQRLPAAADPIRAVDRSARGGWPYWPTSMRIHPLTRIVTDPAAGSTLIEVRVEMRDRDGDTTKATGLLRLDLYDDADESPAGSRAEWNVDLRDADVNRERFDDVTLTYLFRLEVDEHQLPDEPVLRAYFLSDDGADLTARFRMQRPEPE